MSFPVITIDGPSGAGKGTLCLRLAQTLGYRLLDSGALYRIVGLKAHEAGLLDADSSNAKQLSLSTDSASIADEESLRHNVTSPALDEDRIASLVTELTIRFLPKLNGGDRKKKALNESSINSDFIDSNNSVGMNIEVDGINVADEIRNETVGGYASKVAALPKVRAALLDLQKNMANDSGLIADGRDMGTVVFPNADVKVFLTASSEARAQRRVSQLRQAGKAANYDEILANIEERDRRDETRSMSPSKPAKDALLIDSSDLDAALVYQQVKQYCKQQGIFFND